MTDYVKAVFDKEMEPVIIKSFDNDVYIYIHLNGVPFVNEDGINCIEYDYREIHDINGEIDINDVIQHPENYLSWKPETPPTIQDLVEAINAITDLLLGGE